MHIKHLQKADTLLKRLQSLDKEIIQIEKYAFKIKDTHHEIHMVLSHSKSEEEKAILDEDGSLSRSPFHSLMMGGLISWDYNRKPAQTKEDCSLTVNEVIALQVLGVMIAHKEAERMDIIRQLMEMGFEVSL